MINTVKQMLLGQYEASLSMMNLCLQKCPPEHWDGKVARYPFWQVAYHTLCFLDLYLTPTEKAFQLRDVHPGGWSEFNDEYPSRRFERQELSDYAAICLKKIRDVIMSETQGSLEGPSGHHRLAFSRAELHLYNIRHVQHHTGQLTAFLRRADESMQDLESIPWTKTGWR